MKVLHKNLSVDFLQVVTSFSFSPSKVKEHKLDSKFSIATSVPTFRSLRLLLKNIFFVFFTNSVVQELTALGLLFAQTESPTFDYLAFGDFRGYVEPCGCDPETDLGGIKRLASFLEKEKLLSPNLFLFSLGNHIFPNKNLMDIKAPIIYDAVLFLKPKASLFNYGEILFWQNDPSQFLNKKSLNLVLSNMGEKNKKKFPSQLKKIIEIDKNKFVLGYVSPQLFNSEVFLKPISQMKLGWKKLKEQKKDSHWLLLFSGPQKELEEIYQEKIFDEIISSNPEIWDVEPNKTEHQEESKLIRIREQGNPMIWSTPIGGQGVLRGGSLRNKVAPLLNDLFKKETDFISKSQNENSLIYVSWLEKKFDDLISPLDKIYKNYKKKLDRAFDEQVKKKSKNLGDSNFSGAETCRSCHAEAYKVWQNSHHAKAFATLEQKSQDKNIECVACHVLGFHDSGGFISKEKTPQFFNVQCENCHGAAQKHAKSPLTDKPIQSDPKKACLGCHHPPHSSSFLFETYWQKIKH